MASDRHATIEEYAPAATASPADQRNGDGAAVVVGDGRRRRRWPWLGLGLVVGAVGAVVTTWALETDEASVALVEEPAILETAVVERRDLVEEVEWDGELASGDRVAVEFEPGGTITALASIGDTVERGDVIARVDDEPVVVLFGDVPMWRELAEGDDGDDVRQLQANLVRLGFDPDDEVVIDGAFDGATEDMVEAWQESLAAEQTGVVGIGDVVVLPGPAEVVAVPGVGAATGSDAVVELEITEARIDVVAGATDDGDDGRVGAIAEPGAAIAHGTVLLAVDDRHIVAVVEVADETAAILDAMADDDVEALEAILVYVGFDPAADISIDDEIDDATIAAIARWQTEIGVPATGSVDRDDYVVIEGASDAPLTVTERYLEPADRLDRSDVVMALGTPTLDVSAEIAVEEVDEFEIGQMVTVEQLDETAFVARVVEIAEVATPAVGDAAPTMTVDFEVVDEPDRFVSGPVVIVTEASRVDDALVVPTRALLTLREGGFAVERVLGDGTTTLVGVEIGTFDDGVVEIAAVTAGDLGVGDELVVPA